MMSAFSNHQPTLSRLFNKCIKGAGIGVRGLGQIYSPQIKLPPKSPASLELTSIFFTCNKVI